MRSHSQVAVFQETVPAKALACVDQLLLRSSKANLVAIHLGHEAPKSLLWKFKEPLSCHFFMGFGPF